MHPEHGKPRIVILGGNPETGALVEVAHTMGLEPVVLDPYPHSPAKRKATRSYEVDVTDLDAVDAVLRKEKAAGVMVGVADPLVPYYQKICARNGFHCYANEASIRALTSKANFSETCVRFGIGVTPRFAFDDQDPSSLGKLPLPVVIKPVDAGAGVGISVCNRLEEVHAGIAKALSVSIRKELIIEKYMTCDDLFAYYTFVDGVAYLSAVADRHKTRTQGQVSPVCIAAEYPSRHQDRFSTEVHPKLVPMFEALGISDGVLLIQFFVDGDGFYAYDPGFRLQGEAPHHYLKHFNHFDQREMLLRFAISGQMTGEDFAARNDPGFGGQFATTVWILLKAGTIGQIAGLDALHGHPCIIHIQQRFHVGDQVSHDMVGTERQVFARIYSVARSRTESEATLRFIHAHLSVLDVQGADQILDRYEKEGA